MTSRPNLARLYRIYLSAHDALLEHTRSRLGGPWPIVESLETCGRPLHHLQDPLVRVRQGEKDPWDLVEVTALCLLASHDCLPAVQQKAGLPYACELYGLRRAGHLQNLKRWRDRVCHPQTQDLHADTYRMALEQIQLFLDWFQGNRRVAWG